MISLETEICACNSLRVSDIVKCIKENNLNTMEALLDNQECPMGDKCESCVDEGVNNDGINIPLVLAMVKRNQL